MCLLPAHYFEPCSSSLSHFLVSPGHVSHVFTGRTFAFFPSPDGELLLIWFAMWAISPRSLLLGLIYVQNLDGHAKGPPTPLKLGWCLPFLLLPIFAVEPGKLGASAAFSVWRAPLPRQSWALESGHVTPSSECTLPSYSSSMGIIQGKCSQLFLTLELPRAHRKISMFGKCPAVLD